MQKSKSSDAFSKWSDLSYWETGEWQVVREHLTDLTKKKETYCPEWKLMFEALKRTPFDTVRVMIVGQDPYPNRAHATGVAFEVPDNIKPEDFPRTLKNIFKEYQEDLHLPAPRSGNLQKWTEQGVLLWNAYPSCQTGKPGSHNWDEWASLTQEIVEKLSHKGVLFVFLGNKARDFFQHVDLTQSEVILTSHPSPRGNINSKKPFAGSRIFSTINDVLISTGLDRKLGPIDWRL